MNHESNQYKRAKKSKPLFGLFRKTPSPIVTSPTINLGSGTTFLPLQTSILDNPAHSINDPYSPLPKPITQQRRQRSKSVGREAYPNKLLEEREQALNKLCKNEILGNPTSLADSLPLLSPNSYHSNTSSPPPVPKIPALKKSSSAHDLRKAARIQQESINQLIDKTPLPISPQQSKSSKLSRSKSLNNTNSSRRLKPSKSQQQLSISVSNKPSKKSTRHIPPPMPLNSHQFIKYKREEENDSDDDIPLSYLQSPIESKNKPSSLLSDRDDDDDADLVPIAIINGNQDSHVQLQTQEYQSAADKYKERVKERLKIDTSTIDDDDDDDDIPISSLLSPRDKFKFKK